MCVEGGAKRSVVPGPGVGGMLRRLLASFVQTFNENVTALWAKVRANQISIWQKLRLPTQIETFTLRLTVPTGRVEEGGGGPKTFLITGSRL